MRSDGLTVRTSEPSPARVGRKGTRCEAASRPEVEHALVDLHGLDGSGLAGRLEVGVGGDGVEGHEPVDHLGHLAGGAQQPDVGSAVGDDGEVGQVGAEDGPDGGHGLAAGSPPADADGHARCELADELVEGQSLVSHGGSAPRVGCMVVRRGSVRGHRGGVGVALLDEGGPLLVGHAGHVELVGEALLEPVARP